MAFERSEPGLVILAYRQDPAFVDVTYAEMAVKVRRLAAGLIGLGVEKGDRILFSPTRIEFTLLDYAIWAAGGATVTIYETSSPEQVEWIVRDSGARVMVCADDRLRDVFGAKSEGSCDHVITLDTGGMDQLLAAGESVSDETVMERARSVTSDDLASLVYTSGTTGLPKGCDLTVGNFVWESRQVASEIGEVLHEDACTLMFLPLAHIFARVAQVASVLNRSKIAYSTGIPNFMEELAMVRPTWLFSVPRVFEKVYNSAQARAAAEAKGRIFDVAAKVAADFSRQSEHGRVSVKIRILHAVFERLVYHSGTPWADGFVTP